MPKIPSYRVRPEYQRAVVTLTDSVTKKRRDYWLGAPDSPESHEAYHRVIAEWISLGKRHPEPEGAREPTQAGDENAITVAELIARFWTWAAAHHSEREQTNYKTALRILRRMDGSTLAREFGPRRLRLIREMMITGDENASPPREPWSRPYVNAQVKRIRRVFKWAVSHELVGPEVHQALSTVEALRRGRTAAREPERVLPPDEALIEAALPFMSRQVRALVQLQTLTGARPAEVLSMRAIDIDTESVRDVWVYRLQEHKTSYRGNERVIYLGPRAQEVIRPFLVGRRVDAPRFSPAEAEAERRAALSARRKTPRSCGNRPGTNKRAKPAKQAGGTYTPETYYRAVQYACDAAFPPPEPIGKRPGETNAQWSSRLTPEQKRELKAWRKAHRFFPYQLRHLAATKIRREHGLEAAQLALGHSSAIITEAVYAERDERRVVEVMRAVG
jgi:integrase